MVRLTLRSSYLCVGVLALALAGCGGDAGGSPASSVRLYRYGAVSSRVTDAMASTMGSGLFSRGQAVRAGDVVALDGDSMSPSQIAADTEIDRVLAAGGSILLVDAKEAHKESMRGATRAAGSVPGDSHAILYSPFSYGGSHRGVHLLELSATGRETTTKSTIQRQSGIVQGAVTKKVIPRTLTTATIATFGRRCRELTSAPWVDPLASSVPPLVSWMSVPFEIIDQSDDAALGGQPTSEDITLIFRGFYSPPLGNGPFANTIFVEQEGQVATGPLAVNTLTPVDNSTYQALLGWFHTSTSISVTPDRSNPSGQTVNSGLANMSVNGSSYSGNFISYVYYYDASGNTQVWNPSWTVPPSPVNIPNWTLAKSGTDPIFTYYQQSPFDSSLALPDYIDAIDNAAIGQFLPLPAASFGTLDLSGASTFVTTSQINGPVRFNVQIDHIFTQLLTEFTLNPAFTLGSGGTTFEDPGNHPFVIDMALCKPASATQ